MDFQIAVVYKLWCGSNLRDRGRVLRGKSVSTNKDEDNDDRTGSAVHERPPDPNSN